MYRKIVFNYQRKYYPEFKLHLSYINSSIQLHYSNDIICDLAFFILNRLRKIVIIGVYNIILFLHWIQKLFYLDFSSYYLWPGQNRNNQNIIIIHNFLTHITYSIVISIFKLYWRRILCAILLWANMHSGVLELYYCHRFKNNDHSWKMILSLAKNNYIKYKNSKTN